MKVGKTAIIVSLIVLLATSGCATMRAGSDVQSGRRAFLIGEHKAAVVYFQRAAQTDPNYVYYGTALRENIWSYVGRAEYAVGQLAQARQTLERALFRNRDETSLWLDGGQDITRLYLGLALTRIGDRQRGLQEIENGLRGIHDDIEYVTHAQRFSFGQYWDPGREIRPSIEQDLTMLLGKDVNLPRLIADGEWLGKRVEEEINLARRDEAENLYREN
jgi:tetratricopeptide (TPR) repeat protein